MEEDFPPNSHRSKRDDEVEDKKVEKVVSGTAERRKKGLGRQFKDTFVGGDAKTAMHYVVFSVLIPAAKDALADAGSQGIERLIFGDTRRRGPSRPGGSTGHISYNRFSMGNDRPAPRAMSRRARAQHDFDEIVLQSRGEAEEVLERLFDLISKYESASVADLYELTGLQSNHTDHRWGWTDLRGAGVARIRQGYLLDLPDPEPFK